MARRFNMTALEALAHPPADDAAEWLVGVEDSVGFLKVNAESEEIVIYACGAAVLIQAVLAPLKQATPADHDALMHGFIRTDESWVIQQSHGGGEGWRKPITAPGT